MSYIILCIISYIIHHIIYNIDTWYIIYDTVYDMIYMRVEVFQDGLLIRTKHPPAGSSKKSISVDLAFAV